MIPPEPSVNCCLLVPSPKTLGTSISVVPGAWAIPLGDSVSVISLCANTDGCVKALLNPPNTSPM